MRPAPPEIFQLLCVKEARKGFVVAIVFAGNLPKFFNLLESMTKSYLVEFKIHRKIVLDRFPRNFFI